MTVSEQRIAEILTDFQSSNPLPCLPDNNEMRAIAARIKQLEEALKPFAEFGEEMDGDQGGLPDDAGIYAFKASDFRRAANARVK